MRNLEELRAMAERYRRLADRFADWQTFKALRALAKEYEATAERLENGRCTCVSLDR